MACHHRDFLSLPLPKLPTTLMFFMWQTGSQHWPTRAITSISLWKRNSLDLVCYLHQLSLPSPHPTTCLSFSLIFNQFYVLLPISSSTLPSWYILTVRATWKLPCYVSLFLPTKPQEWCKQNGEPPRVCSFSYFTLSLSSKFNTYLWPHSSQPKGRGFET